MIKWILTIKRHPDLTPSQFRQYYEENHVPLINRLIPMVENYQRNYVILNSELQEIGRREDSREGASYDAFTEVVFENDEVAKLVQERFADPKIAAQITADEGRFIAPGGLKLYVVEAVR